MVGNSSSKLKTWYLSARRTVECVQQAVSKAEALKSTQWQQAYQVEAADLGSGGSKS